MGKDSLGEQIMNIVEDTLNSGEFYKLNSAIAETVSNALDEARKQLEKVSVKVEASTKTVTKTAQTFKAATSPRAKIKKVGGAAGVLLQVFGSIGTGLFGFLSFVFLATSLVSDPAPFLLTFFLILLALSVGMIYLGSGKRARLKRAERYVQVMQGKSYINISELALLVNKSENYVLKDVKKMIHAGIFPEGHLDAEEKCLIIGDVAYREYIRLDKARKLAQAESEEQKRIEAAQTAKEAQAATENAELNAMVQEGNAYIKQLRDLNDAIEGEAISTKLFHLENVLKEIFEQLKEHPEQMPEMRKFMEYYLPTTLKLVTAYEEFDRVSVPGEDILSSKQEIEKTLDTINMAFEELLNKLFRARVYDVTTDAQVLKTMLAREGLTREPVFAGRATMNESDTMRRELK